MADPTQEQIDAAARVPASNGPGTVPVIVNPATGETDSNGAPIFQGAEPTEGAAPTPAAPAAAEPTEAEIATANRKKVDSKRFKDTKRTEIYARRDGMTLAERQDLEQVDAESLAILDAQAGHDPNEGVAPTTAATPTAAPTPASGAPVAPVPVASTGKSYKLNVYGQEQEFDEGALIALAQKGLAADSRMRDGAAYEARLQVWAAQLQTYADDVARTATAAAAQPGSAGTPAPTTPGVAGQIDKTKVRQALDALARGDTDVSTELMNAALSDALARGQPAAPAAPAPASRQGEVPKLSPAAADPWSVDQRASANQVFNGEFGHFSDTQFQTARAAVEDAMTDPANIGKDLATIVRSTCKTVARLQPATAPAPTAPVAPAPSPTEADLAGRRVLKARLPLTPPAGTGRAPTGEAPAPTYPTSSQYIEQLRRRSGSNSTRT